MRQVYRTTRANYARLVARVQLRHKAEGHAVVWVSREVAAPHTLDGYVYQTNIGIKTQEHDLLAWINDAKSEEAVHFPAYITQVQAAFGTNLPGQGESGERVEVHAREFLTQGKTMPESDLVKRTETPAGQATILWKAVRRWSG